MWIFQLNGHYRGPRPTSLSLDGEIVETDDRGVIEVRDPRHYALLESMREWAFMGGDPPPEYKNIVQAEVE